MYWRCLFGESIATVAIYSLFFPCKQFCCFTYIADIGCRHIYRMNDSTVLVYPDMRLISEMPCVALLGLMRIRITLFFFIFGRRGCLNEGGIYYRSFFQQQPFSLQRYYDLCKNLLLQTVAD